MGTEGEAGPPLSREPRTLRPGPEPKAGALPTEPPGAPGGVFHKSMLSREPTTKYFVTHFKEKVKKDLFFCYHDNHQQVSCLQRVLWVRPGRVRGPTFPGGLMPTPGSRGICPHDRELLYDAAPHTASQLRDGSPALAPADPARPRPHC